jgi:transglutaminase-like putative cysteine protease
MDEQASAPSPRRLLLCLSLLLGPFALAPAAGAAEYAIAPPAEWVAPLEIPFDSKPPDDEVSSGAHWLAIDRQIRVGPDSQKTYSLYAVRLLNEQGVDDNANLSIDFDPSYQTLTLHQVRLLRGSQSIDQLKSARISVLQREAQLEYRIYDGSLTVDIILDDVRVGDVLVYAYTVSGHNPVFGDRFFDSEQMQWGVPIGVQRLRVVYPPDRPIRHRAYRLDLEPVITRGQQEVELTWTQRDVPALIDESSRPGWHVFYPYVQFSEMATWAEVNDWAESLFRVRPVTDASLRERIASLRESAPDDAGRLLETLRFVQRDVRYLGIEMGTGSHEPSQPAVVLKRRFGDCKDKSLLMVTMLSALGIEAAPVLVDSTSGRTLADRLPTPIEFDHAIVRARLDGRDYWLDPTLSPQSGDLEHLHQPDYDLVLVVAPGNKALERMPRADSSQRMQEVVDVFDLTAGLRKPGKLTVTTDYYRDDADRMRARLRAASRAELQTEYLNYYAGTYEGIETTAPLDVTDDASKNRVRVVEHYRIPKPFEDDEDAQLRFEISAYSLTDFVSKPDTKQRTTPLAVSHPVNIAHRIEVRLPESWPVRKESGTVRDGAFEFKYRRGHGKTNRVIVLDYEFRSLSDFVAPEQIAGYLKDLERVDDEISYWLTYNMAAPAVAELEVLVFPALAVGLLLSVWWAIRLYRYSPPPHPGQVPPQWPSGIRGWLLLPAIGVIAFPVICAITVWAPIRLFDVDTWPTVDALARDWSRASVRPLVMLLVASGVVMFATACTLLVLFFKRRTSVPRLYIAMLWAQMLYGIVLYTVLDPYLVFEESHGFFDIAADLLPNVIWTAYFLRSRRVQATFTRVRGPVATLPDEPVTASAPG